MSTVTPLSFAGLEAVASYFDHAVDETPNIDSFCSTSDWVLSARRALSPFETSDSWSQQYDDGFIAMMCGETEDGAAVLLPLEAMWGLGCPLVGPERKALAYRFHDLLRRRESEWDLALVTGFMPDDTCLRELVMATAGTYRVRPGAEAQRYVASLVGGVDGFLSRRSRQFRKNLRKARRRAADTGIRFETFVDDVDVDELYRRILAVENRSWKGRAQVGIQSGGMRDFYASMLPRLAASGRLRGLFARRDGDDLAFIFGGIRGPRYRGLQLSFVQGCEDDSLGNLCQYAQIEGLANEGITEYDLGMGLEYKRAWAEQVITSTSLIITRQ